MKKILCSCVVLAALLVASGNLLYATDPPAPGVGKVLLLDNARVLEGEIIRMGDRYRIRRPVGELWLPAESVRFVGASWAEALDYLHSQANLIDPDERLRLARWCQLNGLQEEAQAELKQALQLRPNFPAAVALQRTLEHSAVIASRTPTSSPTPAPTATGLRTPPELDLNAESMGLFVTRVQPILMNTCASCHTGGQGGRFQLLRTYGGGSGMRRITQTNLAAVMSHVNLDHPELSPLLIKAVTPHGALDSPPLASRRAAPYLILRGWVESTLASNPHLKTEHLVLTAATTAAPSSTGFASGNQIVAPQNTEPGPARPAGRRPPPVAAVS